MVKWRSLSDHSIIRAAPGVLTVREGEKAKEFWIKHAQVSEVDELRKSVSQESGKVHGRYKRLAVFQDGVGIWRFGSRLK